MKIKFIFIRQGDPVRDLVFRYMGEQEAIKRQILSVDSVTQDIDGLKALIVSIYTVIIHIPVHCLQVYYKIAPEYDEIFFTWFNNCVDIGIQVHIVYFQQKGGCYRSAIDMCRRLLTSAGQGPGKLGEVTQHTVHTLQVICSFWKYRIDMRLN